MLACRVQAYLVLEHLVLAYLVLVPSEGQTVRVAHVEQSRGALPLDMALEMVPRQGAVARVWWARASLGTRPMGVG